MQECHKYDLLQSVFSVSFDMDIKHSVYVNLFLEVTLNHGAQTIPSHTSNECFLAIYDLSTTDFIKSFDVCYPIIINMIVYGFPKNQYQH
jgi:hypothetical protein